MKNLIVLIFCMSLSAFVFADEEKRPAPAPPAPDAGHYAFGPYVSYDSTYNWSIGAAVIKESENKMVDTFHLDFERSLKNYQELDFTYRHMFNPKWGVQIEFDYDTFFDPYYGIGLDTKVGDKKLIDQHIFTTVITSLHEVTPFLAVGPVVAFRSRTENPDKQEDKKRFYDDQESASLGGKLTYDTRDSILDPREGVHFDLNLDYMPKTLSSLKSQPGFAQAKADFRKYTPIYKTVFASRFAMGETLGRPSFLYTYRLGGPDYLRGYEVNRFIGNQFAIIQLEERIKIYRDFVTGTLSYETGSVTSKLYNRRRSNTGIGLRVAMPPDWKDKLSVNFGFGDDQSNIEMEFNENF